MDWPDGVACGCRRRCHDCHALRSRSAERGTRHEHAREPDARRTSAPRWRARSPLAASLRQEAERDLLHLPPQRVDLPLLCCADIPGADVLVLLHELWRVLPIRDELPGVVGAGAGVVMV